MADDIKALAAAVGAAHDGVAKLVATRQAQRGKLSRDAFMAYNAETAAEQLAATQAVTDADAALAAALNNSRQELLVGTIIGVEGGGGVG